MITITQYLSVLAGSAADPQHCLSAGRPRGRWPYATTRPPQLSPLPAAALQPGLIANNNELIFYSAIPHKKTSSTHLITNVQQVSENGSMLPH